MRLPSTKHLPAAALLLVLGTSPFTACRTAGNYLEADRPIYEGAFGVAPVPRAEIRVVSFNIEYALRVPEAIEALRTESELQALDILLLQEMDEPGVLAVARALGLNYVYVPSSVHSKHKRDIGTAVLSPWPIEGRSKVRLPHTSRFSGHARSAVAASVRVGERLVRVYSLHLGTPINLGPRARRDQLEAVLSEAVAYPGPVIIGGDFNSRRMAERAARRSFVWATEDIGRTTALFSFDHILGRGFGMRPPPRAGVVREVKGVSDHHPVWAVFSLH